MDEIKKLFKRMITTTLIFLIIGVITQNKYIMIGLVSGCVVSILNLYILSVDVKNIAYSKDHKTARKITIFGYIKRYVLYMIFLASILYFLDLKYFISAVIGLLVIRINIYIIALEGKLKKK